MVRSYVVTAAVCAGALTLAPVGAASTALGAPGDLVTATQDRGAAPLVQPGLHALALPGDGWIEVDRQDPASTLWIGESLVTPQVNSGEHFVTVHDTEGDCSWSGPDSVGEELVQVQLRAGGTMTDDCAGGSVWVEHDLTSATDYTGATVKLAVWEEPPVAAGDLPKPSRRVTWRDLGLGDDIVDSQLGTDFTDAPELADGRYDVQVAPGVPAVFAVDLDWGQHLQLEMELPDDSTAEAPLIRPRLINPLGITSDWATAVADPSGASPLNDTHLLVFPGSTQGKAGVVSPTIRHSNREEPGNAAAFPGRYFVTFDMEKDGEHADSTGAEIQIALKVLTDEQPQSPYDVEPAPLPDLQEAVSGEVPAETPTADPESSATSQATDAAADRPWPAAIGMLAGSLVCAVAGTLLLGRWRRGVAR